jgi:hypothetical protein
MACFGSSGFQGYLKVNSLLMPYLSADLTKKTAILESQGIHGGGQAGTSQVFRSTTNAAIGQSITNGSVTTEVYGGSGAYANAFKDLLNRSIGSAGSSDSSDICNGYYTAQPLIFCPGGLYEIVTPSTGSSNGKAVVASLDLRGNPGDVVQSTFNIISAGADVNNLNTNAPTTSNLAFETAGLTDDSNPVPYYASNFTVTGSGESNITNQIMDWNISINNNAVPIFAFNGLNYPVDILIGMMKVSGSFKYYSPTGTFVETLTHGASITITFGTVTINLPFVMFGEQPIPSPGPNNPVVRTVNFIGLAKSSSQPSIYQS